MKKPKTKVGEKRSKVLTLDQLRAALGGSDDAPVNTVSDYTPDTSGTK